MMRLHPRGGEQPQDHLLRIFETLFTLRERRRRFPDRAAMAVAARDNLPAALGLTELPADRNRMLLARLAAAPADFDAVATALRDLVRGYTDAELREKQHEISTMQGELTRTAARYLKRCVSRLEGARRRKRGVLAERYEANRTALDGPIAQLAATDVPAEAARELERDAQRRRYHGPYFDALDARALLPLRLGSLDPDLVDFPLRHMEWLAAGAYHALARRWKTRRDRRELLLPLATEVLTADFFDSLEGLAGTPIFDLSPERLAVFRELRDLSLTGKWQAAALIAITQAEGLLWAYAEHLQRSGRPVFKVVHSARRTWYYLYPWDRKTRCYTQRHRNHRPKAFGRFATSGRDLVMTSVLQEAISSEMYTYLLDEFFDLRNGVAHGRTVVDDLLLLQALIGLMATAWSLTEHAQHGAFPLTW